MRIAFMASDEIALGPIEYVASSACRHELSCVISNPDKPKGRGKKLSPNGVAAWALEKNVPLLRPEKNPGEDEIEFMRSLGVDCLLVMAYGHILKKNILEFPKYPPLNLHASLLPKFRGASPIESAIALGEKETGVSLMKIAPKMDSGDVCAVLKTRIGARETSQSLREKISALSVRILEENLDRLEESSLRFIPQDDSRATYARKLEKSDMRLDFGLSAEELDGRIRAFGGGVFMRGADAVKVGEAFAENISETHGDFGKVFFSEGRAFLCVKCARGVLKMSRLQKPCAKMVDAKDFLNSFRIEEGETLESFKNLPLLR